MSDWIGPNIYRIESFADKAKHISLCMPMKPTFTCGKSISCCIISHSTMLNKVLGPTTHVCYLASSARKIPLLLQPAPSFLKDMLLSVKCQ